MAKGMSTTLVIIVAAIVILVAALVVVTVFGGGIQSFLNIFNPWAGEQGEIARCQAACSSACAVGGGTPQGYPDDCSKYPCTCAQMGACKGECRTQESCFNAKGSEQPGYCENTDEVCCTK